MPPRRKRRDALRPGTKDFRAVGLVKELYDEGLLDLDGNVSIEDSLGLLASAKLSQIQLQILPPVESCADSNDENGNTRKRARKEDDEAEEKVAAVSEK